MRACTCVACACPAGAGVGDAAAVPPAPRAAAGRAGAAGLPAGGSGRQRGRLAVRLHAAVRLLCACAGDVQGMWLGQGGGGQRCPPSRLVAGRLLCSETRPPARPSHHVVLHPWPAGYVQVAVRGAGRGGGVGRRAARLPAAPARDGGAQLAAAAGGAAGGRGRRAAQVQGADGGEGGPQVGQDRSSSSPARGPDAVSGLLAAHTSDHRLTSAPTTQLGRAGWRLPSPTSLGPGRPCTPRATVLSPRALVLDPARALVLPDILPSGAPRPFCSAQAGASPHTHAHLCSTPVLPDDLLVRP